MIQAHNDYIKKIKSHCQNAIDLQHTCKIYVATATGNNWSFYFKKGNLVWASSNNHRFRRLYRITHQFCSEINFYDIKLREQEISELWEYLFINVLYKRNLIDNSEIEKIIEAMIKEVLVDCLLNGEKKHQIKIIFKTKGNNMGGILNSPLFNMPITYFKYTKNIIRIESWVREWRNKNIANLLPNLAPVIKDIDRLKQSLDDFDNYQKLFIFIDGKKTIRDLATVSQQDLISIAEQLIPHLKTKAIALQEIADLQLTNLYFSPSNQEVNAEYANKNREHIRELDLPLIICVDNDPHICQQITQILNPIGYRIISVNDAAKTLIVLLENKPELLFINAQMSDANGYELCSQIKRMPALKNIPVILLTQQDKVIDKLRRKISGAVDIILKPLNSKDVLTLTQKYTQNIIN